jgi:hypothetical protein
VITARKFDFSPTISLATSRYYPRKRLQQELIRGADSFFALLCAKKRPTSLTLHTGKLLHLVGCRSGGGRKSRCMVGHDSPTFFEFPEIKREDSRRAILFSF